ncbi:MAG: hypothetical protein KTU85_05885 [Acidimicrobiia bacterium]|nr:hypothetical protein [Acidimicrobiia bacterium]MCY4457073.1 hypothetical protein [Acidimicrobiaceae bacterium]
MTPLSQSKTAVRCYATLHGWVVWSPDRSVNGGRGFSGQFHNCADGLWMWRREAVALDGTMKAVLHTWCRGEERVGATHGNLSFTPGSTTM